MLVLVFVVNFVQVSSFAEVTLDIVNVSGYKYSHVEDDNRYRRLEEKKGILKRVKQTEWY